MFFENLLKNIENLFKALYFAAEKNIGKKALAKVIEKPSQSGRTVFFVASYVSEEISSWILDRSIDIDYVDDKWRTPRFIFQKNHKKMLEKGINPFTVADSNKCEFEERNLHYLDKELLGSFLTDSDAENKTECYYAFHDSYCNSNCNSSCKDRMKKFKLYTWRKKEFKFEKRGGEGKVAFDYWHGQKAAFKLIDLKVIEQTEDVIAGIKNAKNSRAEFETMLKLTHENVVKVMHVFRHQKTYLTNNLFNERKERIVENSTVIVMERHDKNIKELKERERISLPDLVCDTLGQGLS